jgi:hypothetical protein
LNLNLINMGILVFAASQLRTQHGVNKSKAWLPLRRGLTAMSEWLKLVPSEHNYTLLCSYEVWLN